MTITWPGFMEAMRWSMIFKSLTIVTLSWILVAAIILGFASCDSSSSSDVGSSNQRSARKYLELDDLNSGHESSPPVHEFASAEEVDGVEARVVESYAPRPKKFVKRSAQSTENHVRITRQQQLQQQRARNSRQNQQKKQRPGFFWTLARVTFETFNDTRSAIQQIGTIINEAVPPERKPSKKPLPTKKPQVNKTSSLMAVNGTTTTPAPTTTTEAPFMLSRPLLQSLIRRNVKGLVRLFNIEWRDALNQSEKNVQEFRQDLGKQIGFYLQDNPDAY
ncbi:hypothetical protein TSAR_004980 [Trichomalopsis sarcophagae]|uniref:Uncharacterized protein n=1 Tax=Trichomalopsis sarcophagae TaxID=543379 RepID=A0A232EYR1_9HYME|nr:hypothetical protein TSAR_004980 [Trichomalopsis sarcophagae]